SADVEKVVMMLDNTSTTPSRDSRPRRYGRYICMPPLDVSLSANGFGAGTIVATGRRQRPTYPLTRYLELASPPVQAVPLVGGTFAISVQFWIGSSSTSSVELPICTAPTYEHRHSCRV